MYKNRIHSNDEIHWIILFILFVSLSLGSIVSCKLRTSPVDNEVMVFGAKVGTLTRTIQTEALFIQEELAKSQPNLQEMLEAHARIERAYLDLHTIDQTPEELKDLHDLWIEASFTCEYTTNQAIINGSGDLSSCLSQIDVVVKATEKYMPAQE